MRQVDGQSINVQSLPEYRTSEAAQSADIGDWSAEQAEVRRALPANGRGWSEVRAELLERKCHDYDWRSGRVPIYVYHDDDELLTVSREAYDLYFSENALGKRAFPSLASMEDELISMTLDLFGAPEGARGSFTSGGTESIFLALKSARDYFRSLHSRARPNIVIPCTAHPAFDKSAQYLDVDVRRVGLTSERRVDTHAMLHNMDASTMLIAGSAPCYPFGVFDSIEELSEIAQSKSTWLHVDACLGGFIAPFAREEGFAIPSFDFTLHGVTSLSADLHKYGFSAKGASVVLYRSSQYHRHQGFHFDAWPRGTYSTETFQGTRPGGSIASAWAVSQYLGRAGYRRLARKIMELKGRLIDGIELIPGLEVLRPTELCILLYRSHDDRLDIDAVADELGKRRWFVGRSQDPRALHLALNAVHTHMVSRYLEDLREVVTTVRATGLIGVRDDATY